MQSTGSTIVDMAAIMFLFYAPIRIILEFIKMFTDEWE